MSNSKPARAPDSAPVPSAEVASPAPTTVDNGAVAQVETFEEKVVDYLGPRTVTKTKTVLADGTVRLDN